MSKIADTEANATSLDGLVNDNALVPTLRNGPKPSYQYLVDGWTGEIDALTGNFAQESAEAFSEFDLTLDQYKESRGFNTKGAFASGFTYELPNDVGLDASGNPWILIDTSSLPVTVAAGTTPANPPYKQVAYGTAAQVSTNTSDTVQSFIDSFALKIFQSPTSGGLTEIQTRTVDAGEVYEVRKTSDNSLATIYSDAAGNAEIVQDGTGNKSGSDGVVGFYIADKFEELKIESGASSANFKNNVFIQQYAREQGIGVWDTNTVYPLGGIAKGSDNVIYQALTEQSGNNPVSDGGVNWIALINTPVTLGKYTDYIFASIADLESGTTIGGATVSLLAGQAVRVISENGKRIDYIVNSFSGELDLGGGLWARRLQSSADKANRAKSLMGVNANKALNGWGAQGSIINLGDSISHGAFAGELYYNGWTRILARMISGDFGGLSYQGYTPMLTLGSGGPNQSYDIHSIAFSGTWVDQGSPKVNGAASYNGLSFQSTNQNDFIRATIPTFQTKGLIWYLQQPGGGELTVSDNTGALTVIDTNGPLSVKSYLVAFVDDGQGSCNIRGTKTDASAAPVDIMGFGYLDDLTVPTIYNFSESGRRLRYVDESVISETANNAGMFMLSLGHNDQGDVDADPQGAYATEFVQRINWIIQYCNANNVLLVVNDFCWLAADSSYTRRQLRRAADETGGIYIPLPNLIKPNGSIPNGNYLVNITNMWADSSHPNTEGNKWIAETIAKYLGLSVSSKKTAIAHHDYWMPFDIPVGTNNAFTAPRAVSAYRINGEEVNFRYAVKKAQGGKFPVGTHNLQARWRVTPPFIPVGTSLALPGVIRPDTNIMTSSVVIYQDAKVDLYVTDGTWDNGQAGIAKLPIKLG